MADEDVESNKNQGRDQGDRGRDKEEPEPINVETNVERNVDGNVAKMRSLKVKIQEAHREAPGSINFVVMVIDIIIGSGQ